MANKKKPLKPSDRFKDIVSKPLFGVIYVISAVIVLLSTTIYWAMLSARLQQFNSDQLVNSYLFNNLLDFTFPPFYSHYYSRKAKPTVRWGRKTTGLKERR